VRNRYSTAQKWSILTQLEQVKLKVVHLSNCRLLIRGYDEAPDPSLGVFPFPNG
jgi:hypothetical protein